MTIKIVCDKCGCEEMLLDFPKAGSRTFYAGYWKKAYKTIMPTSSMYRHLCEDCYQGFENIVTNYLKGEKS